jgi:hypothetical protein
MWTDVFRFVVFLGRFGFCDVNSGFLSHNGYLWVCDPVALSLPTVRVAPGVNSLDI